MDDKNIELKIKEGVSKELRFYLAWAVIIGLWIFTLNSR